MLRRTLFSVTAALVLAVSSAQGEEPMPEPEPETGCFDEQSPRPCPDFFDKYLEQSTAPTQPAIGDVLKTDDAGDAAFGGEKSGGSGTLDKK